MDGYDYEKLCFDVMELYNNCKFLSIGEIGKSLCGRSLYKIEIGRGEPILIVGGFHGMEHITSSVLITLIKELSLRFLRGENIGVPNSEELFVKKCICFVPCVNPDGVEISLHGAQSAGEYAYFIKKFSAGEIAAWQANARGVDLNHNFDAGWEILKRLEREAGIYSPSPTRFGGFLPESEPEVIALENLCKKRNFRKVMACHSQGEEIYYSYGKKTPPESITAAKKMASLSGYTACHPEEKIASYGGFKDWFIENYGRPGFTVELGKGKNPLPVTETDNIFRKTKSLFFEFITSSC